MKLFAAAVLASAILMGCESTPKESHNAVMAYHTGNFPAAAAALKPSTGKKDENYVLNNVRYGSCAIAAGDYDGAEQAFFAAYEVMNSTGTNTGDRAFAATVM